MDRARVTQPTSGIGGLTRRCTVLLLGVSLGACTTWRLSGPRYVVTTTPIDVLGLHHPGLCIAVDPADAHGVWWWEPGSSGCSRRTTGPTVFRAQLATAEALGDTGAIDVRFQLPLKSGATRDIRLLLEHGRMRVAASGEQVATARRRDLDIPPAYGH